MTVHRSRVFTLDEATLTGGAAILAAGGGLPRRITGAFNMESTISALSPTGYWVMNEASGDFQDRTANNRDLAYSTGNRAQPGSGVGGDTSLAAETTSAAANGIGLAAANYAEHNITEGTPFTVLGWMKAGDSSAPYSFALASQFATLSWTASSPVTPGWILGASTGAGPQLGFRVNFAGRAGQWAVSGLGDSYQWVDRKWHLIALTYSGGTFSSSASYALYVDGVSLAIGLVAGSTTSGSALALRAGVISSAPGRTRIQHVAIWNNIALTQAQLQALAIPTCGTATWTLPADTNLARTIKSFAVPGYTAREKNAATTRPAVRTYYKRVGVDGARVEFNPGQDLSLEVAAGVSVELSCDLKHYAPDCLLPYLADDSGGGPSVFWSEADPVTNITGISVDANSAVTITADKTIGTVAAPVNDPAAKATVTDATANGSTLALTQTVASDVVVTDITTTGPDVAITFSNPVASVPAPANDPQGVAVAASADGAVLTLETNSDAIYPPDSPKAGEADYVPPIAPPTATGTRHPAPPVGRAERI